MRRELIVWTCLWACLGCAPSVGWCQDPAPAAEPAKSSEGRSTAPPEVFRDVQEARREAEVLHDAIHRSLHVIHNRYYREDEGLPLPAAITLSNDCLKCHVPDRKSTEDRTAGLIIAIPLGAATGFQGSENRNQSATR